MNDRNMYEIVTVNIIIIHYSISKDNSCHIEDFFLKSNIGH